MELIVEPGVTRFVQAATAYCALIDSPGRDREAWSEQLLGALADLYAAHFHLPEVEFIDEEHQSFPDDRFDMSHEDWKAVYDRIAGMFGRWRHYWAYFDPNEPRPEDELVVGDLADDLADIYRDVKPGLLAWEAFGDKYSRVIVYDWKEPLFRSHWGWHAVSAMRGLHQLAFSRGLELDERCV